MWSKASEFMQKSNWEPDLLDPDSLVLYGTIVLESLFSSESDKQEVTTRIADYTAALLGQSGNDRYELSKRVKRLYGLRSNFVHGSVDRPDKYSEESALLFKMATLALWEVIRLRTASPPPFSNWEEFEKYIQRRKFGVD
jgi:hypothetical protein